MPGYFYSAFAKPFLPVITNNNSDKIQLFRWGLIPSWVKNRENANKLLNGTYNARSETIWEKLSFKTAARYKRCMVPAHGFFEWHTDGNVKTPYYIKRKDDRIFSFAGLHENWTDPATGEDLHTFSIITVPANKMMEKIHNLKKRMPAILNYEDEKLWINNKTETNTLSSLLTPLPNDILIACPVSGKKLYKGRDIADPSIIEPLNTI